MLRKCDSFTIIIFLSSGPRSVRIRNDEDASLPLAADLIMNIRNAFETEFSSTMGRLLHETDEVIAPVYIIQVRSKINDQKISHRSGRQKSSVGGSKCNKCR